MTTLHDLKTKIYVDGVRDAAHAKELIARYPIVQGFTTNPSLMRKAGVTNYERWARELLAAIDLPISFEVIADYPAGITMQGRTLASWGPNVYVKIPITTTHGESLAPCIHQLADEGIHVNVTAILCLSQVDIAFRALQRGPASCISIFVGRIADTGRDPLPMLRLSVGLMNGYSHPIELVWASPREVLNVWQANEIGCHIITVPPEMLSKLSLVGKPLAEYSRETVKMFYEDAVKAGYTL